MEFGQKKNFELVYIQFIKMNKNGGFFQHLSLLVFISPMNEINLIPKYSKKAWYNLALLTAPHTYDKVITTPLVYYYQNFW